MASEKRRLSENARVKTLRHRYTGLALAALFGIGGIVSAVEGVKQVYNHVADRKTVIAETLDISNDEFIGEIPIFEGGKVIAQIDENTLVLVKGKIGKENKMVNISAVTNDGEKVVGKTQGKYLKELGQVSERKLEECNTVYTVENVSDSGIALRQTPEISSSNKLFNILPGEQVLGSIKKRVKDNKFLWVPVFYINEDKVIEGYVCSDFLKENGKLDFDNSNKKEKEDDSGKVRTKMVVDTSGTGGIPLKLRSEKERNPENIITKLPNGSILYALSKEPEYNESLDWREVEYTDENGKTYTGWVADSYLKKYNEIIKVVDTSKEKGIDLIVRKNPGNKSEKIATIENGSEIKISEAEIGEIQEVDKKYWIKVTLPDDTIGYIDYEFLKDEKIEKEKVFSSEAVEKSMANKKLSAGGKVVGIDISGMKPQELDKLLASKEKQITEDVSESKCGTDELAGNINFVYIKVGSSGYRKFNQNLNENYIEQAKVCEEHKIPYGFYFYSTAITKDEAVTEAEFIDKALADKRISNSKYNLLPFAIDVELTDENDRQHGENLTNVKKYLKNSIEPQLGKSILYGNGTTLAPTSGEKIIDLDRYYEDSLEGDKLVWLAAPKTNGKFSNKTQQYINSIISISKMKIPMIQAVLDCELEKYGMVDINMMDPKSFDMLINLNNGNRENISDLKIPETEITD